MLRWTPVRLALSADHTLDHVLFLLQFKQLGLLLLHQQLLLLLLPLPQLLELLQQLCLLSALFLLQQIFIWGQNINI